MDEFISKIRTAIGKLHGAPVWIIDSLCYIPPGRICKGKVVGVQSITNTEDGFWLRVLLDTPRWIVINRRDGKYEKTILAAEDEIFWAEDEAIKETEKRDRIRAERSVDQCSSSA